MNWRDERNIDEEKEARTAKGTYPKTAIQWLNQALCFYQNENFIFHIRLQILKQSILQFQFDASAVKYEIRCTKYDFSRRPSKISNLKPNSKLNMPAVRNTLYEIRFLKSLS